MTEEVSDVTKVTLGPIRKVIAERMTLSKTTIPHAYVMMDVDMTSALWFRAEFNAGGHGNTDGIKISVNDLVLKATALALAKIPAVNSTYEDGVVSIHKNVNVGVVVAIENDEGILVPVFKNADLTSLVELGKNVREKADLARRKKIRARDSMDGTFTISNVGMFGANYLIAVVQPPQTGILGIGAVKKVPLVIDDQIVPRSMMGVALSFDHRAIDGAVGAKFIAEINAILQNPEQLL